MFVDFVGYDRDEVLFGDPANLPQVVLVVDGPARVGRVVDHDGCCLLVDQGFQVIQIDLEARKAELWSSSVVRQLH